MKENGPPTPPALVFTVTLSKASAVPVTVRASTSDVTALGGIDYEVKSGATITFAPGTPLTRTFAVPIKDDTLDETNETLTVTLSEPSGATIADDKATGTILDDDEVSTLSVSDASADEPNSGTATMTFTVTLAPASNRPVRVAYSTADGTATAGPDYTSTSGTLEFAPGATTKTIAVPIIGDAINEENETIVLNLSAADGAGVADAQGQGTIVDKNAPPSLSVSDVLAREGQGAAFTVTLAGTTLRTVTVRFNTADGVAKAGSDYSARVGTLTFAPGEQTKPVVVTVLDDALPEGSEDFSLTIGDAVNATITKAQGRATIEASDQVLVTSTPPTATPKISPAPKKTAKVITPRMVLGPRTVTIGKNGIAKMLVNCQKASPLACAGTIELERAAKPTLKLGRKTFSVKKGKQAYVSIRLSTRALALLRKNGTVRAKVVVLVKTSAAKPLKVSPGIVTLRSSIPKPKPTTTKVIIDP